MTQPSWLHKLVCVGLGLILIGCTHPQARSDSTPIKPRSIVVGLDKTGSYALADAGRAQVARLIHTARPGDKWFIRWIQERSYADNAILFTLSLPTVPAAPTNPFDSRAKAAWALKMNRINQVKQHAAQRIMQLKPEKAPATDIWGFLAKAAELLADTPADHERLIVVVSDLCDTENKRVPLNLKDIQVIVLAFQSGEDPTKTLTLKQAWRAELERGGASVRFLDVSESPEEALQ